MLKAIGYILLSVMGVVFAMNILPEIAKGRCAGKWKDSGLTAEFKFGTGCVVDIDGRGYQRQNVQIHPSNSN